MDTSPDSNETDIVVEAARSGSGAMIDVVVAAMSDLLTNERVGIVIMYRYQTKEIAGGKREGVGVV